ncbi:MerR family transcriptional regulator [Pedobacter psychroterrae]|uniref:MerR family transcriptional regulator n=1 Tax=Pedobacter psychroterrae TaxID=2530453 RepID=A0A4R0NB00_9SPHI|nr:MerR family transcriptional regulator [Pedobacter psychroterrae]TCC97428.1 MerR family transcriptional regulator [Pedobacter psychroterrae]
MKYSISDLEQLSGVQTHTIRIWERRYKALEPMRSAGNTRFYDDNHLLRLLNIVGLSKTGLKISQVCALSDNEVDDLLKEEIDKTLSSDAQFEYYISKLLNYGLSYNETDFDQLISKCILDYGMTSTYKNVIYPLLLRLGLMWRREHICPAQEHFLSNIIRQKMFVAINDLPLKSGHGPCWLLFLPEDEDHDIGLLFANYVLRLMGHKVLFLGAKVPFESVKDAVSNNKVAHLLLFFVHSRPVSDANEYLNRLSNDFKDLSIHIAGNTRLIEELQIGSNVSWFKSIEEFEDIIKGVQHVS